MDAITPKALRPEDDDDLFKAAPVNAFREFWNAGYHELLPIIPPSATLANTSRLDAKALGKIPGRKKDDETWVGIKWRVYVATESDLDECHKSGAGVGLKTGELVAVDIDVTADDLAEEIKALALRELGPAPCRSRSNSAKCLLLYRIDGDPLRKLRTDFKREGDPTGEAQAVEVLGDGQHFVAWGTHPSGVPYEWDALPEREELTAVTAKRVDTFLTAATALLRSRGYIVDEPKAASAADKPGRKAPPNFVLDDKSTIAWARRHLAQEPIAIEGQGGRQRTINVAMTLVDRGLSDDKAHELMCEPGGWNERCRPPWDVSELRDLIDSLEVTRENERGCDYVAPAAETFAAAATSVSDAAAEQVPINGSDRERCKAHGIRLQNLYDIGKRRPVEYLANGFLPRRGTVTIVGQRGTGKSLLAVDALMSVATGEPLLGRWEVLEPGPVVYLQAEGHDDLWARIQAWIEERNRMRSDEARIKFEDMAQNFWCYPDVPKAASREDLDRYIAAIRRMIEITGKQPRMILIDTQARSTRGADENSVRDMSLFAELKDRLSAEFGCLVVAVAHAGKDNPLSTRGSSVIEDSDDLVIGVLKTASGCSIETTKANYTAPIAKSHFQLIQHINLPPNLEGVPTPDGYALRAHEVAAAGDAHVMGGVRGELLGVMRLLNFGPKTRATSTQMVELCAGPEPRSGDYPTPDQHQKALADWHAKQKLWRKRLREGCKDRKKKGKTIAPALEGFFEMKRASYERVGEIVPHWKLPDRWHPSAEELGDG